MKKIFVLLLLLANIGYTQEEVTVTIAYPDDEGYLVYSIPPTDEHARFGGMYYLKVENTGSVDLIDWEINTLWKGLNSTWGVVEKTVIDPSTGELKLTGPTWDLDLNMGESFVLSGEWLPTSSIEDWITYLPREMNMTCASGTVNVVFDVDGTVEGPGFIGQKVKPIDDSRKTFEPLKTIAYFPLFDAERAWCSLQRYGQNIDQLRVQLYSISTEGILRAGQDLPADKDPYEDLHYWYDFIEELGVIDYCIANDIELIPVVFNYNPDLGDFDQFAVHQMMTTPSLRSNHLSDLGQLLDDKPAFDGIDVDYESLMASDKNNYSAFMEDLADVVHAKDKILTTAVHTKVGPGTWYGPKAQDFERIGNAVDEMLLMTYDLHWATSPTYADPPPTAGCQGTPDWMNDVAFFAVSEIDDPSKIQLGLPFYGYRWKYLFEDHDLEDPGIGLTNRDAQNLIELYGITPEMINREDNGYEPYFNVMIDGVEWICYYQDATSISYKMSALNEYQLREYIGGVGIWRLGGETDEMWEAYMNALNLSSAIIDESIDCSSFVSIANEEVSSINIYPNPTKDKLTVALNNAETIESITIQDQTGRTVYYSNQQHSTISVAHLQRGRYILKIKTGNRFHIKTFLKI